MSRPKGGLDTPGPASSLYIPASSLYVGQNQVRHRPTPQCHLRHFVLITSFTCHEPLAFTDSTAYSSFRCFVTKSTLLFGAGPTPMTVALPAAICVLPASCIIRAQIPKLIAVACRVSISSSLLTCTATFAWPYRSHRLIKLCAAGFVFGMEVSAL